MSDETFKLDYSEPGRKAEVSDDERREQVARLTASSAQEVYAKLSNWDRNFLVDLVERQQRTYTTAQRFEIDRIWNQWGSFL